MDTDAVKDSNSGLSVDTTQPDSVPYVKSDLPVDTTQPGAEKYANIVGVFRDRAKAEEAIDALKQAGIGDDTIQLTEYDPDADGTSGANATKEEDDIPLTSGVSDRQRVLVQLRAEGREQEAVALLTSYGSNNSDLPPGTALVEGSIVDTGKDNLSKPTTPGGPSENFFGTAKAPGHPNDLSVTDSPNPPPA